MHLKNIQIPRLKSRGFDSAILDGTQESVFDVAQISTDQADMVCCKVPLICISLCIEEDDRFLGLVSVFSVLSSPLSFLL